LIGVAQPTATVTATGYISISAPIPRVAKGAAYLVSYEMSDTNGNRIYRYVTVVGT
jgi:hypothetical protein